MAKALVVCPVTDELELIDYVETPLGSLLHSCSRFQRPSHLPCARACARGQRCDLATVDDALDRDLECDTAIEVLAPSMEP